MRRHCYIPDTQTEKGCPTEHLTWIANAIIDYKPDVIVHLGDHWEMGSLSQWDAPGSKKTEGARYEDDIEAGVEAFRLLSDPIEKEIQKLKKNKQKQWNPERHFLFGNHECLDEETEVLTEGGWKRYTDVLTGEGVFSLSVETGVGEFKPVLRVHEYDYDGELLLNSSRSNSLAITPNHRVLYTRPSGFNTSLQYREASHVPKTVRIPVSGCNISPPSMYTDLEIKLCAWLCTDSHFDKYGNPTLYQRESNSWMIESILQSMGIPYKKVIRRRDIKEICGKVLKKPCEASIEFRLKKEHIEYLGVDNNLDFPSIVESFSTEQFDIFLGEVVNADGSLPTKGTGSCMVYGKKRFCDSVQRYAVQHGWFASLTEYRPSHWRVNLCKRALLKQENFLQERIKYKGKVWCLTVKDNENFLVRRKGKACFTGNSRITRAINKEPKFSGVIGLHHCLTPGFQQHPFLEVIDLDGIKVSHYFQSSHSPYAIGGSIDNRLNKIGDSFVQGHVQGFMYGNRQFPTGKTKHGLVIGSCYLHSPEYREPQNNNHWQGIVILNEVHDGDYCIMSLSLDYLKRKYG